MQLLLRPSSGNVPDIPTAELRPDVSGYGIRGSPTIGEASNPTRIGRKSVVERLGMGVAILQVEGWNTNGKASGAAAAVPSQASKVQSASCRL